jgi:serine/threonine protein kinase
VGGYPVLGVLGAGPCGHTYLVRREDGQPAAVKVLRPGIDAGPDPAPRLLQAAQAICQLPASSPHLARVFDAGMDGGAVWLARDYIDGPTLQAAVAEHGPLPASRLRALASAVAAALAALHASAIRHGNLKPGNVLLAAGRPVVVDAGVACPHDPTVVLPDSVRVGAAYLAPEQVAGDLVTPAADVHAWGALVVFAATGHAPFTGPDWVTVLNRVISDPPDLSALPGDLRRLTATAMAKDQASRPTAQQLLRTLSG